MELGLGTEVSGRTLQPEALGWLSLLRHPQVGITLHYSSLSTLLWMGVKARVLHKELTCRAPPPQEGDSAPPAPRPMLRYMLPMVSFAVGRPQRGA